MVVVMMVVHCLKQAVAKISAQIKMSGFYDGMAKILLGF
jgi:hypothetical protein